MRRLVTIVMLLVFLYSHIGHFILLKMKQVSHHVAVMEKMQTKITLQGTWLKLSANEFDRLEWITEAEVRYGSDRYDVAETIECGDNVYMYCYKDVEEKTLFSELGKYISGLLDNSGDDGKKSTEGWKWSGKDWVYWNLPASFQSFYIPASEHISPYSTDYKGISSEVIVPPPKANMA